MHRALERIKDGCLQGQTPHIPIYDILYTFSTRWVVLETSYFLRELGLRGGKKGHFFGRGNSFFAVYKSEALFFVDLRSSFAAIRLQHMCHVAPRMVPFALRTMDERTYPLAQEHDMLLQTPWCLSSRHWRRHWTFLSSNIWAPLIANISTLLLLAIAITTGYSLLMFIVLIIWAMWCILLLQQHLHWWINNHRNHRTTTLR